MSLPLINFKGTNTDVNENLKDLTTKKLSTLDKFVADAPAICDVEFEKITNHHQSGDIYRMEINLEINGKLYRSEATTDSFEKSVDEAKADLSHELQTEKGRRDTLVKRGARRVKELMRMGS